MVNYTKLTKYDQVKDGMRVRCKDYGVQINDAKIMVDTNTGYFLCQNKEKGELDDFYSTYAKHGYKHCIKIGYIDDDNTLHFKSFRITDLELIEESPDEPEFTKAI